MKIKITIILCALVLNTTAQTSEKAKTIFGNGNLHIGYFITPSFQLGKIAGSAAFLPGVGAGIILNDKFSLNLQYKFTINETTPAGEAEQYYLHSQFGGLRFEYLIKPASVVHVSFPLEVGIGEMELDLKDSYENQNVTIPSGDAWFANIEPGVALEINAWKYLRVNFTAGYRFVSDVTFRNLSEKEMKGFTFSAGLKIGLF